MHGVEHLSATFDPRPITVPGPTSSAKVSDRPEILPSTYPITFLAIGDWGKPLPATHKVARQMGLYAERHNATFVVSTGDNFYLQVHPLPPPSPTWTLLKLLTLSGRMVGQARIL